MSFDDFDPQVEASVLDDLMEKTLPPTRQPGDVTIDEYVQLAVSKGRAMSDFQARYLLNGLVRDGKMEYLYAWDPSQRRVRRVYRPLPDTQKGPGE